MTSRDTDKNSDNWRFNDENKPLTDMTISDYIIKYGEERALGYIEAIADIRAEVAWMLTSAKEDAGGYIRSPSKTQKMLNEFKVHKVVLLKFVQNNPLIFADVALLQKLKQK